MSVLDMSDREYELNCQIAYLKENSPYQGTATSRYIWYNKRGHMGRVRTVLAKALRTKTDMPKAMSLYGFFMEYGYLTDKQIDYLQALTTSRPTVKRRKRTIHTDDNVLLFKCGEDAELDEGGTILSIDLCDKVVVPFDELDDLAEAIYVS